MKKAKQNDCVKWWVRQQLKCPQLSSHPGLPSLAGFPKGTSFRFVTQQPLNFFYQSPVS